MSKTPELKPRDKVVTKMTREGAMKENLTEDTAERVSARLQDAELVQPSETKKAAPSFSTDERKALEKKRQIHNFRIDNSQKALQTDTAERPYEPSEAEPAPIEKAATAIHPAKEIRRAVPGKYGLAGTTAVRRTGRLRFENESSRPKSGGRLSFEAKKDIRKLGDSLGDVVHGKIHESEQENSGVAAAHKSELATETAVREATRQSTPHEKASRLNRAATRGDPELKSSKNRFYQKQRIRKEYAAARKSGTQTAGSAGTAAFSGTETAGTKVRGKVFDFVKRNRKVFIWFGVGILAVCFFIAGISACSAMFSELGSGIIASSYLSEDADMFGAEAQYCAMEADLQDELDHYESLHPGYDEYRFDLDDIEHDPYVLISILSALHGGEWTLDEVQDTLQMLFDKQYILTTTEEVEVRYRTETRTGSYTVTDPETGETTTEYYEYDVQVLYNYYILNVELENFNLSHVPVYIMSQDELSMYATYMSTLGNREDLFPDSAYVSKYITNPPEDYEIPETYLEDETFAAMIAEAEQYLGYPYVWGGSNPDTSFDCSGFVSWVLTDSGLVNTGRLSAQGLYNVCTPVSEADAQPGDLIFFVGTYDTPGISHVGIYVGDGVMLHCGDPIQYTSIETSYWQSHFYAFGRPHYN